MSLSPRPWYYVTDPHPAIIDKNGIFVADSCIGNGEAHEAAPSDPEDLQHIVTCVNFRSELPEVLLDKLARAELTIPDLVELIFKHPCWKPDPHSDNKWLACIDCGCFHPRHAKGCRVARLLELMNDEVYAKLLRAERRMRNA